jgi:hypothetical protein
MVMNMMFSKMELNKTFNSPDLRGFTMIHLTLYRRD